MYTIEKGNNNLFNVIITVNKNEWESYIDKAYEKTKSKFNVSGFRKGKVPRKVIEQNYGTSVFYDDALDIAFSEQYEDFLAKETEIEPVSSPEIKLDKFDENGVVFNVKVQGMPEVNLGAYKGLKIEKAKGEVTEDKVEAEINQQREKIARFVEVQRKAQVGDFVIIDFIGSTDGVEFQGGKAENYRLELGSKNFIDNFEDQVVGMEVDETKTIKVKFPENYFSAELKGKDAEFKVTLKKVEEKQLPEINDEFASNVSEFETLADYKKDIKKHLEESLEVQLNRETDNKIIEAVVEKAEIQVPESMISMQVEDFIKDFEARLSYQGLSLQDYLNQTGLTLEKLKEEQKERATQTIKTRLVLEKIIKTENLQVKPAELDEKINEIASKCKKSPEDYKKSLSERELIYFENGILMDKLINFLRKENDLV